VASKYYSKQLVRDIRNKDKEINLLEKIFWRISNSIKRLFDIFAAFIGLILLSPVFLIISVLIKRDSPGPVFYKGRRKGKDGKDFVIYKFRTMYEDPASYQGAKVTAQNDQRITPLGHWLRDTKLNEFPQLFNVLIGDMSMVGPRPEDPDIVETWNNDLQREILSVRPGITSPASVIYRHEEKMLNVIDVMQTYMKSILPSKIRLDQLYVRSRSFWVDVDVIIWTLIVLLPSLRKYEPPEKNLFWGPMYRLFRRYVSWFLVDTLVMFSAFWVGRLIWQSIQPFNISSTDEYIFVFGFALLFSISGAIMGLNRINWSKALTMDISYIFQAMTVATLVAVLFNSLIGLFPIGYIVFSSVIAFYISLAIRYRDRLVGALISHFVSIRPDFLSTRERVLIIGSGNAGQFAVRLLNQQTGHKAYQVIGFIDDDYYKRDERIQGTKVVGGRNDIPDLVQKYDVGIIIFAIHNISLKDRQEILDVCHETQALIFMLPDFLGSFNEITTQSLRKYYHHVRETSKTDSTGESPVSERQHQQNKFMKLADQVFDSSSQNNTSLKAIIFEIDDFTSIAKKYGNTVSEQIWWIVAGQCKNLLRNVDLLGQYESGYIVVLISDIDLSSVKIIINRLVGHISETPLYTDFGVFMVNLNVGISERNDETKTLTTLFDRALADLIYSKQLKEDVKEKDGSIVRDTQIITTGESK